MLNQLKNSILIICVACFLLQSCSSTSPNQAFQDAQNNYSQGKFAKAFKTLSKLAENGNSQAEYALGYMYYYGQGTDQDTEKAIILFQQAANQGNADAAKALTLVQDRSAPSTINPATHPVIATNSNNRNIAKHSNIQSHRMQ